MKVISYNLNKHKAIGELDDLVEATGADILCLQEAVSGELAPEIAGLQLVEATARNRLGLAVYLRRNSFDALEVRSLALKKSLHDRVLKPAEERMLAVRPVSYTHLTLPTKRIV